MAAATRAMGRLAGGGDTVEVAVNQMDQVTQQNAAMVEESTAASHELANEAVELARLMGRFTIGQDNDRTAVRSTPAPAPRAPRPVRGYASGAATAAKLEPAAADTDSWEEF